MYEAISGDECFRLQNKYEIITQRIYDQVSSDDLMSLQYAFVIVCATFHVKWIRQDEMNLKGQQPDGSERLCGQGYGLWKRRGCITKNKWGQALDWYTSRDLLMKNKIYNLIVLSP